MVAISSVAAEAWEGWAYLDDGVLIASRSRKVCMTCHWCQATSKTEPEELRQQLRQTTVIGMFVIDP